MKKITCAILILVGFALQAHIANPGDTTWVHTDQVSLDYYGNFDASVAFPDGNTSYRKILMICTLGQYDCPPGTEYCHQWDYTVNLKLMTPTDTLEMGRFITPYATSGWPRFGSTWEQPYVFDVTDFYPLLQGSKDMRIHYSGYSGGFTAKLSFAFIEGTPARNVVGIKKVYDVSETYGDAANPFNDHFSAITETAPAGTQAARMKFLVTGHGNDNNGCCEFDSHFYEVFLNAAQVAHTDIWRDDCGLNDLYPQGGTWLYDRANWCPGAKVHPNYHELPNVTGGSPYQLDIQFEEYIGSGTLGSYDCTGIVFYYGDFNKALDASVTDIVAPTNDPWHFRANPSGSNPAINVKNTGSTSISSIAFSYGVVDSTSVNYTWIGTLAPLEETSIELPVLQTLTNMSVADMNGTYEFEVAITAVNGQGDEDSSNNNMISEFTVAPLWPSTIILNMKTNNIGASGYLNQNPADVSWIMTDMNGNAVASRANATYSTQYRDTINLPAAGTYKLKLTSVNCYGLNWWALAGVAGYQSGNFKVTDLSGASIPMKNYAYSGTPHDDWGCAYTQYFTVDSAGTFAVSDPGIIEESIRVYPNPATDYFNIEINGLAGPYNIQLVNIAGKTVYQTNTRHQTIQIPTHQFSAGVYMLVLKSGKNQKKVEKIVITQ